MLEKIEGKRRRRQQRMRWLDGITYWMDMNLGKLGETVKDREAWHATVCGAAKSQHKLTKSQTQTDPQTGNFHCKLRFPLSGNPMEISSKRVWPCVSSHGKSSSESLLNTPRIPPYLQLFSLNMLHETLALGDTDTCYGSGDRCHKK